MTKEKKRTHTTRMASRSVSDAISGVISERRGIEVEHDSGEAGLAFHTA